MFRIAVKQEIIKHGAYLVDNCNFGMRGVDDGNKDEQRVGIISQCAIMDLMGYELPELSFQPDNGVDIIYSGIKIDIKTIASKSYPTPDSPANIMAKQKHYNTDIYIFSYANRNDKMLTITGWMDKKEFFSKAKFRKTGDVIHSKLTLRSDDYSLDCAELNQVNSLTDLIWGLDEYCGKETF